MRWLVTGGSGFIGGAVCRALAARGDEVIAVSRRGDPDAPAASRVRHVCLDLADPAARPAPLLEGVDGVFHVAAKVDPWGEYDDFYRVNVAATVSLLENAKAARCPRFVYTSSPSVIAGGGHLRGVDESHPYPRTYHAHYPRTKALGEQAVLAADDPAGMRTCALRPHLVFGPGDTHIVPMIQDKARRRRLLRIGDGKNMADFTYVDDCVSAHLAAARALGENPNAGGRPYFVSAGRPYPVWEFIGRVLEGSGLPPVRRAVPTRAALAAAALLERASLVLRRREEPPFTRFIVSEMATDHYFSIEAARRELGYAPAVSVEEGLRRLFPNLSGDDETASTRNCS